MKKFYLTLITIFSLLSVLIGCNHSSSSSSSSSYDENYMPPELIEKYGDPNDFGQFAPSIYWMSFELHYDYYYQHYFDFPNPPEEFLAYINTRTPLFKWGEGFYEISAVGEIGEDGFQTFRALLKHYNFATLYKAKDALERYASTHSEFIRNVDYYYTWSEKDIRVVLTEEETQLNRDLSFYKELDDNIDKIMYDYFQTESERSINRSILIRLKNQGIEEAKATVIRLGKMTEYFRESNVLIEHKYTLNRNFVSPEEFYANQKTDS